MNINTYPHGTKLEKRLKNPQYSNEHDILAEILERYYKYRQACENFDITPYNFKSSILNLTNEMNKYIKFFMDAKYEIIKNNSQCRIYPSLFEENMRYLLKSLVLDPLVCGEVAIPTNIFYKGNLTSSNNFEDNLVIEYYNCDFAIGYMMDSQIFPCSIFCPIVAIETKKYADSNMRKIVESNAKKVKAVNENCAYYLIAELFKGCFHTNSTVRSNTDQMFAISNSHELYRSDIMIRIYATVLRHIQKVTTITTLQERIERGYMIDDDLDIDSFCITPYDRQISAINKKIINEKIMRIP